MQVPLTVAYRYSMKLVPSVVKRLFRVHRTGTDIPEVIHFTDFPGYFEAREKDSTIATAHER